MHLGSPHEDIEIAGLTADSRCVRPGYLFAAIPGTRLDGRRFIADALRAGAAAILAPPDISPESLERSVPVIHDPNPRRRLARMAALFYETQPSVIVAVTGTNGKTSVASFVRQIWTGLGIRAASLGTLGLVAPDFNRPGNLTTPDPVDLHRVLAELAHADTDHLAIEASSHGLAQNRLDGVVVEAAAFTNLTRDHLDYHGSMAAYREAKLRLFSELVRDGGAAVVNAEIAEFPAIAEIASERGLRLLSYGFEKGDIRCRRAEPDPAGWTLDIILPNGDAQVRFPLPGRFQIANALAALGLVIACGADGAAATARLAGLQSVPGRLECVARLPSGGLVLVDYAHTPDALATVLAAVRPHAAGRLMVVFGCGGERDPGKRPEMGAVAAQLADSVIVTDDNPRGEDPATIRRAILAACPGAVEIPDRRDAIGVAVSELGEGDVLIIAGKGHETGQIVGDRILPFEDAAVVREFVHGGAS